MSIEGKEWYRNVYLQSDEWKTVRSKALLNAKAKCFICGKTSVHNDAHHVTYPENIWETTAWQLRILCRECHVLVHTLNSVCSNSSIPDKKKFKWMVIALQQWFSDCENFAKVIPAKIEKAEQIIKQSLSQKELRRIACRLCGQINPDTEPRNIVAYYGIEQKMMLWPFCEACYSKFHRGVRWPKLPKKSLPEMPAKVFIRMKNFLRLEKKKLWHRGIPKPFLNPLDNQSNSV